MINLDEIRNHFRGRIKLGEPMSRYTSFRIGGPADYYLEPAGASDVAVIVPFLRKENIPFIIIGKGSNMLVSDKGIRGAVLNFEHGLNGMRTENDLVIVESGVTIARFVDFCVQRGFQGVEMLPGIPGTVGGAVMMNAGAYGGEISDNLVAVSVLRDDKVVSVPKAEAGFAYRRSGFGGDVILGASFKLPAGDKAEIMRKRRELLMKRNRAQPVNFPNSGSMFKNPPDNFAAKLIEDAGLKGTRRGEAQISERHANFIVNLGGATADDVLELIELARRTVHEKFQVNLELEVKLVGFSNDVLREVYP
ncbi:MAG: UDP-N-acetylenolpyruvoylglucosamine reductase [Ignavibacteria bacterium 13_1_40CM_2_61_4]|nr:MAG: UDP-N-acetylenolpyruvoylglucosamine reductase [Ignavibacteria bacterium 13_1_40CM_2_61_4]